MAKDDKILIIADDRVGTYSQAVALICIMYGTKFCFSKEYNFLKFLIFVELSVLHLLRYYPVCFYVYYIM